MIGGWVVARELQEAWLRAQARPAPVAGAAAASDSLLTPAEARALMLRAGRETPPMQAPRRGRLRLTPGGRS